MMDGFKVTRCVALRELTVADVVPERREIRCILFLLLKVMQNILNTLLHPDLLQPPQIVGSTPHLRQDESSIRPLVPPLVSRSKALFRFQLLQANLGVQGANELLNNIYNIVKLQSSVSLLF